MGGRAKALERGGGSLGGSHATGWFAAGFTSGSVEIWSCKAPAKGGPLQANSFSLLRKVDTKVRLTCMSVWAGKTIAAAAKKAADAISSKLGEGKAAKPAALPAAAVSAEEKAKTDGKKS